MKSDWGDDMNSILKDVHVYIHIVLGKSERGREKEKENEMTMYLCISQNSRRKRWSLINVSSTLFMYACI